MGGQEEDVLPKWRSGRQNLSFGSSKLLDYTFLLPFLTLLHLLPGRFLLCCTTLSHISGCLLPPAPSPVMFPYLLLPPSSCGPYMINLVPSADRGLASAAEEIKENGRWFWQGRCSSNNSKIFLCRDLQLAE